MDEFEFPETDPNPEPEPMTAEQYAAEAAASALYPD